MSRSRRRLLLALGLLGCLLLAGGAAWLLWPRSGINPQNAARIKLGMARPEVETILGGPARDEVTQSATIQGDAHGMEPAEVARYLTLAKIILDHPNFAAEQRTSAWRTDYLTVVVQFGDEQHVMSVVILPTHPVRSGFLAPILNWLRL